jgi:hypothetical protein
LDFWCWARLVLAQHWWVSFVGPGWFWPSPDVFVGQTDSGPALLSGPGLAQTNKKENCWAEIGPTLLGLSPAQLFGPAQPT